MMTGKRLALAAVMAGFGLALIGGLSSSTGQTQEGPGTSYGGLKDQFPAWLRLDPGRRAIAAVQIDWAIAPGRCSNRKAYSSTVYAGYEEQNPISVAQDGTFSKTVVDRFREQGERYEETQAVSGRIADEVVTGSITSRVRIVKPSGLVVRCKSRIQRWRLVD